MFNNEQTLQINNLGHANIVKTFVIALTLADKARTLFKDFSYQKLLSLGFELLQYGNILAYARQALEEFQSMTPDKATAAKNDIKEQFDIEDDNFEAQLEGALELIVKTYVLFTDVLSLTNEWGAYFATLRKKEQSALAA